MAEVYDVAGDQTTTTGLLSVLGITSATTIRPRIIFANLSVTSTPADYMMRWVLQRYTAAGTATSVVPSPRDPAAPATLAAAGSNHTAEPTYTSAEIKLDTGLANRNTYPFYCDSAPIILPATAANGVGFQVVGSTGGNEAKAFATFEQ